MLLRRFVKPISPIRSWPLGRAAVEWGTNRGNDFIPANEYGKVDAEFSCGLNEIEPCVRCKGGDKQKPGCARPAQPRIGSMHRSSRDDLHPSNGSQELLRQRGWSLAFRHPG